MPSEIKSLVEQRKREEQEKLEKAEQEGKKVAATMPAYRAPRVSRSTGGGGEAIDPADAVDSPAPPVSNGETPKPADPPSGGNNDAPVVKPITVPPPVKKTEPPPAEKPEGKSRKGKKGEG
jgi:hypothetical protein